MNQLDAHIFPTITQHLNSHSLIALSFMCRKIHEVLSDTLHELYHKCISQIEENWDELRDETQDMARAKKDMYKSPVCSGWEATVIDTIACSIYPWKEHDLK